MLAVIDVAPQMDATKEYATLEQNARISLEQAQRDERRADDLLKKGAISTKEYETAASFIRARS